MVFLLILTLCGDPQLVLLGDGQEVRYQYWSKLSEKDREAIEAAPGGVVEIWPGKCV